VFVMTTKLVGVSAASGLSAGTAVLVKGVDVSHAGRSIDKAEIDAEIKRFECAVEDASRDLERIQKDVAAKVGQEESEIFGAHALMVLDPQLSEMVKESIKTELVSAEKAVLSAAEAQAKVLESMDDEYFAARATDMRDVGNRLVKCLMGVQGDSGLPRSLQEGSIIVAHDLAPSDTAALDVHKVAAMILDKGGKTSHTAILARSLGIPAVVGLQDATASIKTGDTLLVDGDAGVVTVNPSDDEYLAFRVRLDAQTKKQGQLRLLRDLPSVTKDGRKVELAANIGGEDEIDIVKDAGAEGVGLFRTEFMFIQVTEMLTEEEQFQVYKKVLSELSPRPVVIRTLDAGSDKELPYLNMPEEENPFLGLRAIRLCLQEREKVFRPHLRALLRASVYGKLRIMFPMIASLQELREAKAELEKVKAELLAEGIPVSEDLQIGIMVEVPSAAICADVLGAECDFFSIGTNDLVQYTMACDRGNAAISYLSDYFYPGVLRLIAKTIEEGHKHGIWVGMCGEMAGSPAAIPLLVGMGIDELSMAASSVPQAKAVIRNLDTAKAKEVWERVKGMSSNTEIRAYLEGLLAGQ
jgi:phosphotransferase system enzyme I (PtsI)